MGHQYNLTMWILSRERKTNVECDKPYATHGMKTSNSGSSSLLSKYSY
jgi:hypothetical protein